MYSEDSKKKVYYLSSDIIALVVSYFVLAQFYPYHLFDSKFFAVVFGILIVIVSILSDEYSTITNRGYLKELKASVIYGMKVLVLFTFVLILGKIRFTQDISQMSYFFLGQIFILVSLLVFIGRILVKNFFKGSEIDAKRILLVTDFTNIKRLEEVFKHSNYQISAYISHDNQSPGPLIFKQKRVGKNGKVFEIYKFRSMYTDAEERKKDLLAQNDLDTNLMFKMEGDPRIFPFGHKLRDWSLDELPQFINVLKGEMSVVGTRPPTLDEYRHYELHHFKRLTTKPGITGLWQVSGRSDITDFEEVVALDMKYIQNWSISEDIKIIAKTFGVVLSKKGSR